MPQRREGPTFAERQVGRRLAGFRERAGKTQEDAALALDVDLNKIQRMEHARSSHNLGEVAELARVYGCSEQEIDDLKRLTRGSRERGFTDELDVPQPLELYSGAEAAAGDIDDYCIGVISGLLQSERYAAEIIGNASNVAAGRGPQLVKFRMQRQQILRRPQPPRCRFVVHQAALEMEVGPPDLMQEQVERLYELDALDHIDIRIWRYRAGLHEWGTAPFTVLRFPDPMDPDVAYVENPAEARYLEKPQQVQTFKDQFGTMFERATSIREVTWPRTITTGG